jgi:membrane-bound metal-dependent hydrolase YbcI (DUF457 family)
VRIYTHGLIGHLVYLKGSSGQRRQAAAGAMLPDLILAVGFIFHVSEPWTRLALVADLHALFHHSPLHTVTVALHSFVLVLPLLGLSYLILRPAMPFVIGMLSHGVVDLLTHRGSAYNHLFPIPARPLGSPLDYTDPVFTVIEHVVLLATVFWLYRRRTLPAPPRS